MPKIKTAKGKEYECSFMAVSSSGNLYIRISAELEEAFSIFNNLEETETLQWVGSRGELIEEEHGYTEFTSISIIPSQCPIEIVLRKRTLEVN